MLWLTPAAKNRAMLSYQLQDSSLTLAEGLAEYRSANPGLELARDPAGQGAEFFRCHDTAHVVFGCSTSLLDEAAADAWTVFGTTVTLRQFLGFLRIEEHQNIIDKVGRWGAVATFLRAFPRIALVAWRSSRMRRKWPWASFEGYLDRRLAEIRREFGIRVLLARESAEAADGGASSVS